MSGAGSNNRGPSGESRGGRAKGVPNRDKTELRAMTQEAVLEFTSLRRDHIARNYRIEHNKDITEEELDMMQPLIEEWDPVVSLALIGTDYRNKVEIRRQANADAAQYLRPKLKSIELLEDPESQALNEEKVALAGRLVDILVAMEAAKRK